MSGIFDFHSHILPGIDDGSASVEESLEMLRLEREQGISRVVATPHFYAHHDSPERFLARREKAEKALRSAMSAESGLPELTVGAEVYFFPGISDCDAITELTIGKKSFILIEMPESPWTPGMFRELENIQLRYGITPVIAHVDRYIAPFRTHGIPEQLERLPVLVQANANFFLRSGTRRMALRMLRKGQIHLLGSDCHDLHIRRPNLGDAVAQIEQHLGTDILEEIRACQAQILPDPDGIHRGAVND